MAAHGTISKIAKIFISVAAVTVAVCVAGVCYLSAGDRLNIPEIFIHTDNGGSAQAIRGGFEWSAWGKHILSDSMSPLDFNYSAENSLTVKKGVQLTVSNKNKDSGKQYYFTVDYLSRYTKDGIPTKLSIGDYSLNNGDLIINSPVINGEYIYDITLTYKQGTVNYGFKVFVADDGLPVKIPAESTEANRIEGKYFPMTTHAHTFTFDGKPFTPETDFMYMDESKPGLDEITYFDVDALCSYARELSALSENQINSITVYKDTKTIGEHRYINLIDLRGLGIYTVIGWIYSSHTPVDFSSAEPVNKKG